MGIDEILFIKVKSILIHLFSRRPMLKACNCSGVRRVCYRVIVRKLWIVVGVSVLL